MATTMSLAVSGTGVDSYRHDLVVPGQVIATATLLGNGDGGDAEEGNRDDGGGFLRGHGTYLEEVNSEKRLVASVCGVVHRVNKLVTVIPAASTLYNGNVGDLVVGRIVGVGTSRWRVQLGGGSADSNSSHRMREAHLPLSGVHLPGGVQRIRTAQDQRDMRQFFKEGDLVSAEVHSVGQMDGGSLSLHTRSTRYGKLENGCLVSVPPALIPRRKNHYMTNVVNQLDILWGMNGNIWIQRKLFSNDGSSNTATNSTSTPMSTTTTTTMMMPNTPTDDTLVQEQRRKEHAETPVLLEERMAIARMRNAIECLRLVHCLITPEHAQKIYQTSLHQKIRPAQMLSPENVIQLTAFTRSHQK